MTIAMQPIYTQTVGSGGAISITFNNIPQTFTDLKLVCSVRTDGSAINFNDGALRFNGDASSVYSFTGINGLGSSTTNLRQANVSYLPIGSNQGSLTTSNTFTSWDAYISNYNSSNFKSIVNDGVPENNATATNLELYAGLWRNTSAITSMTVFPGGGYNFTQYSTFSLYGITKG